MNPATFNTLLEELEVIHEIMEGNPFNAVAESQRKEIMNQLGWIAVSK